VVHDVRVPIVADVDMVQARAEARALALDLGFSRTDATLIATAISEIARNILIHAHEGEIVMESRYEEGRCGLVVVASDRGPGIKNVDAVFDAAYSTRAGLGLGIPGARRLMDEFAIESRLGRGTVVSMVKWRTRDELELLRERRRRNGELS
jgi:serine/threonine-protein kinase RsbT